MRHRANPKFWQFHAQLPEEIQRLADENYELLKADSRHPSLHFKKVGRMWSVRVGIHYRAAAVEDGSDIVWFWIGHHTNFHKYPDGSTEERNYGILPNDGISYRHLHSVIWSNSVIPSPECQVFCERWYHSEYDRIIAGRRK